MLRRSLLPATLSLVVALGLLPQKAEAARAPIGRHYMVLQVEHLTWPPAMIVRHSCLSFERDRVCDEDDWCGSFVVNERSRSGNRWWGVIDKTDARDPLELVLFGQTEGLGHRSSIGGTIIFSGFGVSNGGFLGSEAPRKRCLQFAADGPAPEPQPPPAPPECTPRERCCKICSTGKACGDSCISRLYTCRKPPGCACNASDVC